MTQAYIIQAAKRANLILDGVDDSGDVEWLGNGCQHAYFNSLVDFHENYGRFPVDDSPYTEIEPGVFIK